MSLFIRDKNDKDTCATFDGLDIRKINFSSHSRTTWFYNCLSVRDCPHAIVDLTHRGASGFSIVFTHRRQDWRPTSWHLHKSIGSRTVWTFSQMDHGMVTLHFMIYKWGSVVFWGVPTNRHKIIRGRTRNSSMRKEDRTYLNDRSDGYFIKQQDLKTWRKTTGFSASRIVMGLAPYH